MVLSSITIALWSSGLITGWWLSRFLRGRASDSNRLPLPPGPKGYPIIDNLLDMPTDKSWQTFDKWSKIYGMSCTDQNPISHCAQLIGDMVFFKILGQPFLVLGSVERTYDLFEKRSSNYSDRPRFPMFNELSVVFSPFMSGHAHWKAGWILHGTWLSVNTGPSGGTIAVPSMIISIQTSSTSIIRLK